MRARLMRLLLSVSIPVAMIVTAYPMTAQSPALGEKVLLGTWRLDLTKSKYFPGPAPLSETRIYTADDSGVLGVINRVYADGHPEIIEWRANYDREQTVTGTRAYDAIKLKKIDDYTSESTLSHAGVVFGTARREISRDGNTMTITFERKTADDTIRNVAAYYRVRN
jgi:hypothetical protein